MCSHSKKHSSTQFTCKADVYQASPICIPFPLIPYKEKKGIKKVKSFRNYDQPAFSTRNSRGDFPHRTFLPCQWNNLIMTGKKIVNFIMLWQSIVSISPYYCLRQHLPGICNIVNFRNQVTLLCCRRNLLERYTASSFENWDAATLSKPS